jgi:hypothetical protein
MQSAAYRRGITLTLYDEYENRTLTGMVTKFDRTQCRIDTVDQVDGSEEWEWIQFEDVTKAELSKEWTDKETEDL